MNSLQNFVNWKLTHADKTAEAEGYPLVMENCKANKKMKQLKVYGNSVQDGSPTPEEPIEIQSVGESTVNLFDNTKLQRFNVWNVSKAEATETGVLLTFEKTGNDSGATQGNYLINMGLASQYAGKTLMLSSIDYYSPYTQLVIMTPSNVEVKVGSKCTEKDGLYYSTLSIEEDTYTDELLIVRLFFGIKDLTKNSIEFRNLMLAESDIPLPYEPYGKYKIPITIRGENFAQSVSVSANNYSSYSKGENSYTIKGNVGTSEAGYDTGQLMIPYASASTISNNGISVQSGETYNISFDCLLQEIGKYNNHIALLIYYKYDSGGVGTHSKGDYYPTINEVKHYSFTFTAKKTERIGLCFRINNNLVTISNIRVENANVTPITTNVFLNEPLGKRGNYADYIDFAFKEACHYNVEGTPYMYEDLDITLQKLTAKTTIIEVETNILPSSMYGKYIKR